ncbi:hypothetical protein OIU76_021150 [Salix suchowensis]|nr:hypothetical protein OIU76_021150 [Salix suchowensis]
MEEFVNSWVDASDELVQVVEQARSEAIITEKTSKVVEMAAKVMYRSNRIWHWYSSSCYTASLGGDLASILSYDTVLRSTFVSIVLELPSEVQTSLRHLRFGVTGPRLQTEG